MKQFNDFVHYVRNGVHMPAIVLNSRMVTETIPVPNQPNPLLTTDKTTERLTLLYADPITGPSLVQAGKASAANKTEFDVKPLEPGMVFGWLEMGEYGAEHDAPIKDHLAAIEAVKEQPVPEDVTKIVTGAHKGGMPTDEGFELPPLSADDPGISTEAGRGSSELLTGTPAVVATDGNPAVTESGKSQEQLDAEIGKQDPPINRDEPIDTAQ